MHSYTINLSDGLIDIEHSFCFCGPMGIPKHTMAENVIDALTNVFNSAVVECTYDISGEWIEIVENETGSVYRHMITKIPDFDRFLGEFEYNGIEMIGIKADFGELDDIPTASGIYVARAEYRDDPHIWGQMENLITDIMPLYYICGTIEESSNF